MSRYQTNCEVAWISRFSLAALPITVWTCAGSTRLKLRLAWSTPLSASSRWVAASAVTVSEKSYSSGDAVRAGAVLAAPDWLRTSTMLEPRLYVWTLYGPDENGRLS